MSAPTSPDSLTELNRLVAKWLSQDRDEDTRRYIEDLVVKADEKELRALLCSRLAFGTAGLRAQMGAGYSRINSLTIIQTSQGVAEFLLKKDPSSWDKGVVIGYDARHNSEKFAELTAAAFQAKGFKIWWYDVLAHTPLVPYAITRLGAAAGVMITASHNPAQDNGYKLYGPLGYQINSPVDQEITASILENLEPISWHFEKSSPLVQYVFDPQCLSYKAHVADYLKVNKTQNIPAFVYTPMHGVGSSFMEDMLAANFVNDPDIITGYNTLQKMTVVEEQYDPDPDFPTVKYPNPEEDGALDLAKKTADSNGNSLIFANDPDADRFAAAEKVNDKWHQFTGDQMGILLAHHILSKADLGKDDFMLVSAVSSGMLSRVGNLNGFTVKETLTGFKWLGQEACDLIGKGKNARFGYEEALGYMFPSISFDKDGIVAAGAFLQLCSEQGSPYKILQGLYQKYGYFETMNTYWRSSDVGATKALFEKIRTFDLSEVLPQFEITRHRDLSTGLDTGMPEKKASLPSSPGTQMITCWLNTAQGIERQFEGVKFTIRASGTEPKIKIYLECWDANQDKARNGAAMVLKGLKQACFSDKALVIEEKYSSL